ncbi:MAG: hypothetical protein ACYC53_06970 [Bacillota bacterium]
MELISSDRYGGLSIPGGGSDYYRALKSFFAPYKNHEAIRLATPAKVRRMAGDRVIAGLEEFSGERLGECRSGC